MTISTPEELYRATMPILGDTPEASGFRHAPGTRDPEDERPDRRLSPVGDLVANGHGFTVQAIGTTKEAPNRCRYCYRKITNPGEEWVCEFSGDVNARPISRGTPCQCNACEWNEDVRKAGRPAEVCSINPDCQKRRKADKAKAYRERRKAEQASVTG